jgi:hypothetical protein
MNKEEIIAQIKRKKSELSDVYPVKPHKTDRILQEIVNLIAQLIQVTPPNSLLDGINEGNYYRVILQNLLHTKDKEGSFINYHYQQANKKNAAQKRQDELDKAFQDLISQVNMDTFLFR